MLNRETVLRDSTLRANALFRNVYLWMIAGLALTSLVAYAVASSPSLMRMIVLNPMGLIVLIIAEFALVFYLSSRIETMKSSSAIISFLGYSALTGATFSTILYAYTGVEIAKAFLSAAGVFAGAAIYGSLAKRDISGIGRYLSGALFGIIIAMVLNMFFRSSSLDLIMSIVGAVIFTGLIAWDSQRIRAMNDQYGSYMTTEEPTMISILAALNLYLDFLNVFLFLLRIFGRSDRN